MRASRIYCWLYPELLYFPPEQREAALRNSTRKNPWDWFICILLQLTCVALWLLGHVFIGEALGGYPQAAGQTLWLMLFFAVLWFLDREIDTKPVRASLRKRLLELGIPLCPTCGYDLRGQTEPRCPECGKAFAESLMKCEEPPSEGQP